MIGSRELMEQWDIGGVAEHLGDGYEDSLDCVDSLEFAEEVDVELSILGPLSREYGCTLALGLMISTGCWGSAHHFVK